MWPALRGDGGTTSSPYDGLRSCISEARCQEAPIFRLRVSNCGACDWPGVPCWAGEQRFVLGNVCGESRRLSGHSGHLPGRGRADECAISSQLLTESADSSTRPCLSPSLDISAAGTPAPRTACREGGTFLPSSPRLPQSPDAAKNPGRTSPQTRIFPPSSCFSSGRFLALA